MFGVFGGFSFYTILRFQVFLKWSNWAVSTWDPAEPSF